MNEAVIVPPPPAETVHRTLASRTADVDRRVLDAFQRSLHHQMDSGLALVAVGGYGRKELFPQADVDLLMLTAADNATPPREAIADFLQSLWDAGLRPSHSVHSVPECAAEQSENAGQKIGTPFSYAAKTIESWLPFAGVRPSRSRYAPISRMISREL